MINALFFLKVWLSAKYDEFAKNEKGEVSIVAMVVLIGIAVVLAIVFRDAISNLIKTMLNTITNNAKNAIS